jgi:recombination protein RecA
MNDLRKRLKGNKELFEKIKDSDYVPEYLSSGVITMNLLHKGKVDRAVKIGCMEQISADSSFGKSFIACNILKNAQKHGMETIVIDTERAFSTKLAESVGVNIDEDHLLIVETANIGKITQALALISEGKTRTERRNIFVLVDSWGPLVDDVTMEKAADGNTTQNMRLPQEKNKLANYMNETDMTYYIVNGVYKNTGGFGDPYQVGGGGRLKFNSQSVVLATSKAKDKDSAGKVIGAIITCEAHKGRDAVEKSTKLKFRIKHDGGLDIYYGLLPDALDHGCVTKPKNGWFHRPEFDEEGKNWRESKMYCKDFWEDLLRKTDFKEFLESKYSYEDRVIDVSELDAADFFTDDEE